MSTHDRNDDALACADWIKHRALLPHTHKTPWTAQNADAAYHFLKPDAPRRLFAYVDPHSSALVLTPNPPPPQPSPPDAAISPTTPPPSAPTKSSPAVAYFLKPYGLEIDTNNISHAVQHGTVRGAAVFSLLRVMSGVFVPSCLADSSWPETIKKEFTAQLHKFMASLTETAYETRGKTVLYIPTEEIRARDAAASDKQLVQRLNSTLIHWTRQIKEVVNRQDDGVDAEDLGPLAEVRFWLSRKVDLSGIHEQLECDGVRGIVSVLEAAKSSYLKSFHDLSRMINEGHEEAVDNLRFLDRLSAPCEALARATPAEVPGLLPTILATIRLIWRYSRFYHTNDRLTGLLRKVSNEIINRSRAAISIAEVLDGDVEASRATLEASIHAGVAWRECYRRTKAAIFVARDAAGGRDWEAQDQASIFAQVDAFVQRCRDLLEVSEGQVQFLQSSAGASPPPEFGGCGNAGDVVPALLSMRSAFERQLALLRALPYDIFDVKAAGWHDDFNVFKSAVKDLEVMFQNVITTTFEAAVTTESRVGLVEAFSSLARRDVIKRCVEEAAAATFVAYSNELSAVKRLFDKQKASQPVMHRDQPRYAGAATWARCLRARIRQQWEVLEGARCYAPSAGAGEVEEAEAAFVALDASLDEFVRKMYSEWIATIDNNMARNLERNLLVRTVTAAGGSRERFGPVEMNFDKSVLQLFAEVHFWERLQFEIPYVALDIAKQSERFRVLRENVMHVAREFNGVLAALTPAERRLFSERLLHLERKLSPGLTKYTWISRAAAETYLREARRLSLELMATIEKHQRSQLLIDRCVRTVGNTALIALKKKQVYTLAQFQAEQSVYREEVRGSLTVIQNEVRTLLRESYSVFDADSDDVQREWRACVRRIDAKMEDALRLTVKRSLAELSRSINGDAKTEVQPLFSIQVDLLKNRVEFKPSILGDSGLTQMVNTVSKEAIATTAVVPRLVEMFEVERADAAERSDKASFYTSLSDDEDVLKVLVQVMGGMRAILPGLQKFISTWDRYKHIWDVDKEAFMRRYAKLKRALTAFETDITRYKELQHDIQSEEGITIIGFIRIDAAPLKQALVTHCHEWQLKFTQLLNFNANTELTALYTHMERVFDVFSRKAATLDELAEQVRLHEVESAATERTEARFESLETMYRMLEKFEVQVKEEELAKLADLRPEWDRYKQMLADTAAQLQRSKAEFKDGLLQSLSELNADMSTLRSDFARNAPTSAALDIREAHLAMAEYSDAVAAVRKRESGMASGLSIFSIGAPDNEEIGEIERELELLQQLWGMLEEWNGAVDSWKAGRFSEIDVDKIEEAAVSMGKRIRKLPADAADWSVMRSLSERVGAMKALMPLITDLRNPAMRERHWSQLIDEVGIAFEPASSEFNLEKVLELGLEHHQDAVSSISQAAGKELAIEEAIGKMERQWDELALDLTPYKTDYIKLRSVEDLYSALDDNVVALATMKASRYATAFFKQLEKWEHALSHISETIEVLMGVQRKWMYLESIFVGSEDIRRQLPAESASFDEVNAGFCRAMERLQKAATAYAGCHEHDMLPLLVAMDEKLDRIQKSLDEYLETKRQAFPRFYFLSNDDLLEILGQARDPLAVQPHMRKCFEAVKTLEIKEASREGKRVHEAHALNSPDGEVVPLLAPVVCGGPVEGWLLAVEGAMTSTLSAALFRCYAELKKSKREKWIKDWAGQLTLAAGQISWTVECTRALYAVAEGQKLAMRQARKKQTSMLNKLCDMVRGSLGKLDRKKVVAILTVEVHARDVIDRMVKAGCASINDFEWLLQLRFYWDQGSERCVVKQTNTSCAYGYEYLGNPGRLVITPLTDRCYTTLTTALHLHRGGLPQGPAGTGKTETVKDLSKNLAKQCIVFNCSDGLDYKSLGRMFSGLAQTGAWSCFDEFNRIEVEVLSVVAQQILSILTAVTLGKERFVFEGKEIKLDPTCGIFVTMNPGYAGRSELPENLKALLRPMSMMTPDISLIIEIMLYAEGFTSSKVLSKKMTTLYHLMTQQLSKQDHYDFGLRSVKSVLNQAGALKRAEPDGGEDAILLRSIRDMNMPKFVAQDMPLFNALLSDLFPGVDLPAVDYGALQAAIEAELRAQNLQVIPNAVAKCIQTYESKLTRHGNMLVGPSLSGKSTAWQVLSRAMTNLNRAGVEGFQAVRTVILNPKSIPYANLYGEYDLQTFEWTDGVLSKVMREVCADEKPDEKWLLLDGPVDTLWIESMNTVLDDNKLLTLINGERIAMPPQVSLLFEVEDLSVASPATVSRAGMVYVDPVDLGWQPFVSSWLDSLAEPAMREHLAPYTEKVLPKLLAIKSASCREPVAVSELGGVRAFTRLFDALVTQDAAMPAASADSFARAVELYAHFALIWAVGGTLDEDSRKEFDSSVRELDPTLPRKDTVYEYFIDPKKRAWAHWEEKLSSFRIAPDTPFFRILVPTVDTLRYSSLLQTLVRAGHHVLLTGAVGVGKTSIVGAALGALGDGFINTATNFSARTSSMRVSDSIESMVEKRTKDTYAPAAGKRLIYFIDDFNMPEKEVFGAQPPLEILRQWMQYGFWYDLKKQTPKHINDTQLVGAMGHPGGGRTQTSARTLHCFHVLNLTFPAEAQIRKIFGSIVSSHLATFDEDVKLAGEPMVAATYEIYLRMCSDLLPTPDKPHYTFNLRDISRVIQGVLQSQRDFYDSRDAIVRLWVHETWRVLGDRLTNDGDRKTFASFIETSLSSAFGTSFRALFPDETVHPFGDFMRGELSEGKSPPYEELPDASALKRHVEGCLEEYNDEPGTSPMDLVCFSDAIGHVCRIKRVLSLPRGHAMLVGVGGSGRQSLTRLAAYIAHFKVFSIEVVRGYKSDLFRDDLKKLYDLTGVQQQRTVFLFNDTQVIENSFLEDINGMLTSGEVPGLYAADELSGVREAVRADARAANLAETNDSLWAYFVERVRAHLHIVLCVSPVGESFRSYVRMFPALVSCTTIDWFSDWPADALKEVASKFLEDVQVAPEHLEGVSSVFATAQQAVLTESASMLQRLGRHNYVTPTNYLELVKGYCKLLLEKRKTVGDEAAKLRNGLQKLSDTATQVSEMSVELEQKKKVVAKAQVECEEMLVVIVQEKRIVDEQQKQVSAESDKVAKEEAETLAIKTDAQNDLDKALPALEAATQALELLNKKDMSELKAYQKPPPAVQMVMEAVMILRKADPTWAEAKKHLGDPKLLEQLVGYDKDQLDTKILDKVAKYTKLAEFDPELVKSVSTAAKSLCQWVRAMETYGRIAKEVAPKRAKLEAATKSLKQKQAQLEKMNKKVREVTERVQALHDKYTSNVDAKEQLRMESEELELKLERATALVEGLSGERTRWEASIGGLDASLANLVGDCLLAAAFLSYCGPFDSAYREKLLVGSWLKSVRANSIPCSDDFDLCNFLANAEDVRDWNIQKLPADSFSTENAVIVTRGTRWPLMIDPQEQANKWVKAMEASNSLKVVTLKQADYLRTLENAITFGTPVLMQEVEEELDPSLEPILSKAVVKVGNRLVMKLGDKEVDYNPDFRFYLSTKLANPHYTPEISTKASLINFCVKQQGLEEQLLGIVVRKERPDLEAQKSELVVAVASGKRKLVELQDSILRLLSTATGSLLDDTELVLTLQTSKTTSDEIGQQLEVSEQTELKIDAAREGYRPCADRASIVFFLLSDLANVDPMYQFSLDSYVALFQTSVDKSGKSDELVERIKNLNEYHTYNVYRSTCRSLFEAHKLLFSFQICVKVLQGAGKIDMEEYDFFLRGGQVFDKSAQPANPCSDWISEVTWDHLTELDKLPNFSNLIASIESSAPDWREWYRHPEPETAAARLPGEWENRCSELQRLILVRCLRPDRIVFATTNFVVNNLGSRFTEPPVLDLGNVVADSKPTQPLIFVLSPGVDPTTQLMQLSAQRGVPFHSIALGQGQSPHAIKLIDKGLVHGHWVLLANCHLMISWLTELDKMIEAFQTRALHADFRLWLSSSPHPKFPIGILQRGVKMTTEPPKGLKANMTRLISNMSEERFEQCTKPHKYKKLLFAMCWFHSILVDRRKFGYLGWNIPYDFNDSDFEVSELCLRLYLDEYDDTPWDALKYLVSEINYGGRVTDDWDRRLMNVYMAQFFCDDTLDVAGQRLSSLPSYVVPDDGPMSLHREACAAMPQLDRPEAYGQHSNADISSQIEAGNSMLGVIVSLQPRASGGSGDSPEDTVYRLAGDLLTLVPEPVASVHELAGESDGSSLHTVLVQELQRYNALLRSIRHSLGELRKGIKGLVVMSADLDSIFQKLFVGQVPPQWLSAYPSLKPLASWSRELLLRWAQLTDWCEHGVPNVFWLAGFTYPTGFLTALLQNSARETGASIDMLSWEFPVLANVADSELTEPPAEGAYIKGLFLEGAGWNYENSHLCDPEPMQLVYDMPIVHFRPVEAKKSKSKSVYACPLYLYPLRTGSRERPSYMLPVDLRTGASTPEVWTKRGTALLLSLAD